MLHPQTVLLPDGRHAVWISEDGGTCPETVAYVDDALSAKQAARQLRDGVFLVWTGDFHQARTLMKAIQRRIRPREDGAQTDLASRWLAQRRLHTQKAEITGRFLILIEPDGSVVNRRAPPLQEAMTWAWGPSEQARLVPYRTLVGALGAAGWRRAGIPVAGLSAPITPHYGVFTPTRHAYLSLLDAWDDVRGCRVLDVGCGTGVLSFLLLSRGAASAVATDLDPRSVVCANENAVSLGFSKQFTAIETDLFPVNETFDRIVFNPPWVPADPATRLDRAVYDAGGQTVCRWLAGVQTHLNPSGEAGLIVSDFPERLGLRSARWLQERVQEAGLHILSRTSVSAQHGKSQNRRDPFYDARKDEQISLYRLVPNH